MPGTIANLWPQVYQGFAGVDCILHAGDLHVADVIDELETIAPTFVCAGNGDLDVHHHRLKDQWLGHLAGIPVGLIHRFPTPRRADASRLQKKIDQHFGGGDPRVVIYGHTHLAELHQVAGRTYINPGSPTLPNNQSTRHGTVGFMEITATRVHVELHQITERGLELIQST
jgi:putative phosphoesterase